MAFIRSMGVQSMLGQRLEIGRLGFRDEEAACPALSRRSTTLDISSAGNSLEACACDYILILETVVGNIKPV